MGIDEYSILKKKPKKNAFAATALLISIAIALLVMVGAVLVLSKVNDNDRITPKNNGSETGTTTTTNDGTTCEGLVKEIVFNDNLDNIKEAAISYFTNERLPQTVGDSVKITLGEMNDKKLVRTVYDASANACDTKKSYVEVTKLDDEYEMKIFLSCSDIEDYIIVHLGCYDYCDKDVCEKKEEIPIVYEYQYKKTTSCVMGDWSKWGSWKTTREKTSSTKREDVKTETTKKEVIKKQDVITNESFNCDKYGKDYKLVGTSCVKATTITAKEKADPNPTTYNCDRYGKDYKLVGNECVKNYTYKDVQNAQADPTTYNCNRYSSEYKLEGTNCVRRYTAPDKQTAHITYSCKDYGSEYKLEGTNCVKKETVDATPKYRYESYTCYKKQCTTKSVFSCPTLDSCGNQLVTTCENVKKTCSRQVVSEYTCPDDTYTKTQDKDGKWICTKTTPKNAKPVYDCSNHPGYDLSGTICVKQVPKTDTQKADPNPTTYNCKNWPGYTKVGTTCTKDIPKTTKEKADPNPTTYNCKKWPGYEVSGTYCVKVLPSTDTKEATKKITYSCPRGYDREDKTCIMKTTETVKTTYYRYSTRSCTGGSTSYKWSTSKNDSILKSEGYKATGVKRQIKDIVK